MRNRKVLSYLILFLAPILLSSCLPEKKDSYEKYLACLDKGTNAETKIHQKYCFDKYSKVVNGNHLVNGVGDEIFRMQPNKNYYTLRNTSGKILAVKTIQIWIHEKDSENPFYPINYFLNCEHKMLPAEDTEVVCWHDNVTSELKESYNVLYKKLEDAGTRLGGWAIVDVGVLETD